MRHNLLWTAIGCLGLTTAAVAMPGIGMGTNGGAGSWHAMGPGQPMGGMGMGRMGLHGAGRHGGGAHGAGAWQAPHHEGCGADHRHGAAACPAHGDAQGAACPAHAAPRVPQH